jgi:hypothetical protein
MLSFTIGRASISIMIDGEFNTVDKSALNYEALKVELQKPEDQRDIALIKSLISTKKMIEAFSYGKVKITEDEKVLFDGNEITNYLASRMLQIMNEGYDVTPFAKFMERVYANPQPYTRDELYEWLEAADLPIMSDGRFIAFKKVKKNYTDCHTGKFDNSVGQVLVMDRKGCDPDRNQDCSTGFHFCSAGYLTHFRGDRVIVLAIDPADVTAIPRDYNRTKGRTCRYEVIGELDSQSEAYKAAWKRGVVEFDDDTELPDVNFETKPKSIKTLQPMQMTDARDKAALRRGGKQPRSGQGDQAEQGPGEADHRQGDDRCSAEARRTDLHHEGRSHDQREHDPVGNVEDQRQRPWRGSGTDHSGLDAAWLAQQAARRRYERRRLGCSFVRARNSEEGSGSGENTGGLCADLQDHGRARVHLGAGQAGHRR